MAGEWNQARADAPAEAGGGEAVDEGRLSASVRDSGAALQRIRGTVKWFDATRGFGFLVSDEVEGDVLVHFSTLRGHGRRSLPEGARLVASVVREERGYQAREIFEIDLSEALVAPIRPRDAGDPARAERAERAAQVQGSGDWEPVAVKWFNRLKGYGFLTRGDGSEADIFVHMETVRRGGLPELQPGDALRARVTDGTRGLLAVAVEE